MGTLHERLTALCESKGVSGSRMCLDLGLSKSTMSDLKYGRTKGMNAATAQKIASYFNVPVAYLLGEEDIKKEPTVQDDGLSEDTRAIIELVKNLSEEKAKLLLPMIKAAAEAD